MGKKLRISFTIPFSGMTGGIAVVLEYCRRLRAMGHEVNVYYPLLPYIGFLHDRPRWKRFPAQMKLLLRNLRSVRRSISLFSENITVTPVFKIGDFSIKDADAVIATAWPTAYDVAGLSEAKGRKFYLVQHYEIWSGCKTKVDNSYRLPVNIITIAPWLTELMKEKFGRSGVREIHNGIRLDRFYPPEEKRFDTISVLLMAHDLEWKGTADAIEALAIVRKRHPQVTIKMFGMCERPNAPFDFEYHKDPPYEKLLELYQSASVFISPSHTEGWGLPVVEAMACGCAAVATNTGCVPVINNGRNIVVADAQNPQSIADGAVKLIEDGALAESVAAEGLKTVREMGWEKSAQTLLDHLENIIFK